MNFPKPKDYPKTIYIREITWKIQFTKKIIHFGDTEPNKHVIRIKIGMSDRETFNTFVHEVLHAMDFSHKINLNHKTVYALEVAIAEFLVDNFL